MDTDLVTHYGTSTAPNPYELDAPEFTEATIDMEKADQLEKMFADGRLITDAIYDGDSQALDCSECHKLGPILSALMTCPIDERSDHIDSLKELFARPFDAKAKALAIAKLEAEAGE